MTLVFRTLIVDDANVALARQLSAALAGPAGDGMYNVPLSADGSAPATHWISTGWIDRSFALLMPCADWEQDADGNWVTPEWSSRYCSGQPATVVALAAEAGVEVSLAEVQALFSASDITEQEWPVACERLGLRMVQPAEQPID